jgi:AcrR family transcriptional regulator
MVIRQRAIQAEDKQQRYDALLDAALELMGRVADRVPSVAEVADAAGLAKGTVYLYFPSKEEMLLALHERNMRGFFAALTALVEGTEPVTLDAMVELTRRHLIAPPLVLPLASRCFGLMAQSIPPQAAEAYRQRVSLWLLRAGAGLERHFPELGAGGGARLLRHSYALIIGLWQMSASGGAACVPGPATAPAAFGWRYDDELERALRSLWGGAIARLAQTGGAAPGVQR